MERFFFMKLFGMLLLFIVCLHRGISQEAVSAEGSLSKEIGADWMALQERMKALSPEDRIAAADQWEKSQQPKLQALKQAKIQSVQQMSTQGTFKAVTSPPPATELERINVAIEKEFQSVRDAKLSPEESIRQMDEAMEKTSGLLGHRSQILLEMENAAKRQAASAPTAPPTPEEHMTVKCREILEQANTLSPEERIATIDARKEEFRVFLRNAQTAGKSGASSSIYPQ